MQLICKMLAGSRLFGCDIPTSDYDYKGVYLVSLDELLRNKTSPIEKKDLGVVPKIEEEYFYIGHYMSLLAKQESVPLSMLFTPPQFWINASSMWEEIYENRSKFISGNIAAIAGYARSQAQKYSLKGARLQTLIQFKEEVESTYNFGIQFKTLTTDRCFTSETFKYLENKYKDLPGVRLWTHTRNGVSVRMIEVCGKSFGETTPAKLWIPPLEKLLSMYGTRSQEAMSSNSQDLKAIYHAIRIISEGIELLTTGGITYPRPEVDLLIKVRNGELTNDEMGDIIDERFQQLNELEANPVRQFQSSESQKEFCKNFAIELQKKYILGG